MSISGRYLPQHHKTANKCKESGKPGTVAAVEVAFPVSSYTHKLHTVRRSPVQICFIAASVRVSACAFFRSAIGLVFKRTVEFHVRHQETMSAIFLTNTYLFCNHCINYLMNHVTRRGKGAPRLARSRDYYDPTLHSYTTFCSVLFIGKMKFFILFRTKVKKKFVTARAYMWKW